MIGVGVWFGGLAVPAVHELFIGIIYRFKTIRLRFNNYSFAIHLLKPGAIQDKPGTGQEQARSRPGAQGQARARSRPGARQEQARSRPESGRRRQKKTDICRFYTLKRKRPLLEFMQSQFPLWLTGPNPNSL